MKPRFQGGRNLQIPPLGNFFSKDLIQIENCIQRYLLNKKNGLRNLVPLYALFLDMLNFEINILDIDVVRICSEFLKIENSSFKG